ncbi:MAG: hypothetical protein KBC18_02600 [Candidatus Saccharicenans sp.]|nr:hypothetical protein [Candidatus Saccharicenans sp.]
MIKMAALISLSQKSSPGARAKSSKQAGWPKSFFFGFSLLESLISLSLSLFILVSALEVMTQAKRIYSRSQSEQEAALGAAVALEKIREDLERAGAGLEGHRPETDCWPIKVANSVITMYSGDITIKLAADIEAGQTSALVILWPGSDSKLRAGRTMLLAGQNQVELVEITGVMNNRLFVSPAFSSSFRAAESAAYLLETVEFYLDSKQPILRRKVNGTSGQPLLEEVSSFEPAYDQLSNLVSIRLGTGSKKEKSYEFLFYPKNTAGT